MGSSGGSYWLWFLYNQAWSQWDPWYIHFYSLLYSTCVMNNWSSWGRKAGRTVRPLCARNHALRKCANPSIIMIIILSRLDYKLPSAAVRHLALMLMGWAIGPEVVRCQIDEPIRIRRIDDMGFPGRFSLSTLSPSGSRQPAMPRNGRLRPFQIDSIPNSILLPASRISRIRDLSLSAE